MCTGTDESFSVPAWGVLTPSSCDSVDSAQLCAVWPINNLSPPHTHPHLSSSHGNSSQRTGNLPHGPWKYVALHFTDRNVERNAETGRFPTCWWSCWRENVQHRSRGERGREIIKEILRQRGRGLGGERVMEEQRGIQAKERPTRPSTLSNHSTRLIHTQPPLTPDS